MAKNFKGSLIGGFDLLRLPDAPTVSGTAGADSIDVVFTDPSDVGGGSITSRTASATTGGTTTTATGTGTTVTVTSLSAATYTVGGFVTNDFGNSLDSATVSVQILFDRAVFFGGAGNDDTRMDYVSVASTGNASTFGTCSACTRLSGGIGSTTRGVVGSEVGYQKNYQYVTIASTGNAQDFGELINRNVPYPHNWGGNYSPANFSNGTRGLTYGGYWDAGDGGSTYRNGIEYITIASTGNGTDFGDAVLAAYARAGFASSTRGVCGGGQGGSGNTDSIDYITIASTGNGTDFGNLSSGRRLLSAASSSTRGVFAGGYTSSNVNTIDYITIASTGNATDFGDLTAVRRQMGSTGSNLRGLFAGGTGSSGGVKSIDYITFASTGNASDFGDLSGSYSRFGSGATSSNHGGLH